MYMSVNPNFYVANEPKLVCTIWFLIYMCHNAKYLKALIVITLWIQCFTILQPAHLWTMVHLRDCVCSLYLYLYFFHLKIYLPLRSENESMTIKWPTCIVWNAKNSNCSTNLRTSRLGSRHRKHSGSTQQWRRLEHIFAQASMQASCDTPSSLNLQFQPVGVV